MTKPKQPTNPLVAGALAATMALTAMPALARDMSEGTGGGQAPQADPGQADPGAATCGCQGTVEVTVQSKDGSTQKESTGDTYGVKLTLMEDGRVHARYFLYHAIDAKLGGFTGSPNWVLANQMVRESDPLEANGHMQYLSDADARANGLNVYYDYVGNKPVTSVLTKLLLESEYKAYITGPAQADIEPKDVTVKMVKDGTKALRDAIVLKGFSPSAKQTASLETTFTTVDRNGKRTAPQVLGMPYTV